ncbi:GTP-binding protein [Natronobiforma cellulositropha]|uniref:GTP-binding protein n=1 Tax=Natronobiforma cellulositropha TaxID=1679076 RepID=UPI0021D5A7F8|nr:GTP-binding protein [Natronobiforma cellulositropha]
MSSTPVTVLCGALGAGKTTLLSHLLASDERDVAVLVNDVGEVNVDADLVEARTDLADGGELVALENGCICCSLGGELSRAVIDLWRNHDFDALVIEASGVGEPEPIAEQFVRGPAGGPYDLDALVTVVDARDFYDRFVAGRDGTVPTRSTLADTDATRPLSDLLLEQIEFCDHLVLNKCDLVSADERDAAVALLETLQPHADVVTTEYGVVDPDTILERGGVDLESIKRAAGWKQAVESLEDDLDTHTGHDSAEGDHDEHSHDHGHDEHSHDHGHDEHSHDHGHDEHSHDHGHDEHSHDHGHGEDCGHDHGEACEHDHDHSSHDHESAHARYGIEVDGYRRGRPFHPERFARLLASLPDGLVRAKGLCWIAGREDQAITMSFAGSQTTLGVTGRWIASLPESRQEPYRRGQPDLPWDERWGDRESRLALIGRDLDVEALAARLDECLLTDEELAAEDEWTGYENPAPTAMGATVTVDLEAPPTI